VNQNLAQGTRKKAYFFFYVCKHVAVHCMFSTHATRAGAAAGYIARSPLAAADTGLPRSSSEHNSAQVLLWPQCDGATGIRTEHQKKSQKKKENEMSQLRPIPREMHKQL
jgi:hypothetical protein